MNHLTTDLSPRLRIGAVALLLLLLAACGTVPAPEATDDSRFELITTVTIDVTTTRSELEAASGGSVVVFRPEAGFAIVAFEKGQGDLALMTDADPNQDMIGTPEANANGWTAWSGGWTAWSGGWTAWSGGWTAWSGGWTAWSGGWTAWSGGWNSWAGTPAMTNSLPENLHSWDQINLPQGHLLAPNLGAGVKVAVIDTGVFIGHPAIDSNLAPSSEWKDYIHNDDYPHDDWTSGTSNAAYGHGTAVAGVILQVAPNATILPIRVLDSEGIGDVDDIAMAIDWAVQMGADVINLSLGTTTQVGVLTKMLTYAADQGVFVIASAGNENNTPILHPAQSAKASGTGQYLVSVGSIDDESVRSSFSNYGPNLEIMTPGEQIRTLSPYRETNGPGTGAVGTQDATGTSFSAPMIAGSIALALGEASGTTPMSSVMPSIDAQLKASASGNPTGTIGGPGVLDLEGFLLGMGQTAPAPVKSALYVRSFSDAESASGDAPFIERLGLLGFGVTEVASNAVTAADANGHDLVVISSSVNNESAIGEIFDDVAVPLVTWEEWAYGALNMTLPSSSDGYGTSNDKTQIGIASSDHPLAAGFSGDVTVYEGPNQLAWGRPSSSAYKIATISYDPSRAVVFAYEAGANMVGMTAPARRVGLFHNYYGERHSYQAWAFFDAAMIWATTDSYFVDGTTFFEAEAPSSSAGAFTTGADSGVAGGAYMQITQGIGQNYNGSNNQASLHFDLNVQTPDTYYLWMRVYGPDSGSDSFDVEMDNSGRSAEHFGSQGTWLWKKVGSYYLNGNHTLTFSHREDGARLDRVLITDDASFTPTGLGN